MRKTIIAASLASAALALPGLALAQAAAPAAAPAPTPDFTFTGNAGLFSDYRFRGIDQTYGKPAIQGGMDFSHVSGIYLGNWDSNVNSGAGYPGGNIEMDFYGGWKKTWGDWGIDIGSIYYYYPGSNAGPNILNSPANNKPGGATATGSVHNTDVYIAGSWKWISLKYSDAVSNYFSTPNTKNSGYVDLSATYDLGDGWGVTGHVGHLNWKNMNNGNYTDYKLGVTKDLGGWTQSLNGWILGATYVDTNAKGNCGSVTLTNPQPYCFNNGQFNGAVPDKTRNAGKGVAIVSIMKTF